MSVLSNHIIFKLSHSSDDFGCWSKTLKILVFELSSKLLISQ